VKSQGTHIGTLFAYSPHMKHFFWVAGTFFLSLGLAVGCGDGGTDGTGSGGTSSGGTDTGGSSSGGSNTGGSNTGGSSSGGSNTGGSGEGGEGGEGLGGEGGAGGDALVAACEGSLQGIEGCDSSRECNYDIAEAYCSAGNATATLAMSACFQLAGSCHTPADPGNDTVRACFDAVIGAQGTDVSASLRETADDLCDDDDYEPLMLEVFAVMAGEDLAEGMVDCVEAASDCADVTECLNDNLGVPVPASCE